jgi:uncharacterized membrane protein
MEDVLMGGLVKTGRVLFSVAMVVFGVQCLVLASGAAWPLPGPPWTQGHAGFAWLVGFGFLITAIGIALPWHGRLAANLLATGMLLRALILSLPKLLAHLHDPGGWTTTFEIVAMCGAALVIAETIPVKFATEASPRSNAMDVIVMIARYMFAVSLVVFGVQHFMYAEFVGMLVPAWIPWHLFWAYATGAMFFVAAASLIVNRILLPVAGMLAAMFLLWVVVLHAPRVAQALHNGNEWTSAAVALAMGGAALAMAGFFGGGRVQTV